MRLFENSELRSYGFSCFRRDGQGCQDELEFRESCGVLSKRSRQHVCDRFREGVLAEIVRPQKGKNDPEIGPVAVMVSSEIDLNMLRRRFSLSQKSVLRLMNSRLYCDQGKEGKGVAIVGPVIGSPCAVLILERLVALGAQSIIFFGWCGSISPDVNLGEIVLVDRAVSEEGTSKLYPVRGEVFEPSETIARAARTALASHNASFCQGGVWTTDAPYRETEEKALHFRKMGALAVEMELSALFAVGRFRNVKVGGAPRCLRQTEQRQVAQGIFPA
jgi:uridine phosphorylase